MRMRWLADTFPDLGEMAVIDLGGRLLTWQRAPVRPKLVHVVNLETPPAEVPPWAEADQADVCALPPRIARRRYDLVFSNSVIEHVGGHVCRRRFAESVHLLAGAHWVQTPYRYFPIEPHWLVPGLQFLPVTARARLAQHSSLAPQRPASYKEAVHGILNVELLDRTQMHYYFPTSVLCTEWLFGLPKSLIAYCAGALSPRAGGAAIQGSG